MIDLVRAYSGRVVFDHLPKTAGQAINAWLINQLGSGCVTDNLIGDHLSLIKKYGGNYSIISAHVNFNGEGFDPRYQYVTLFREPIDRALSWIFFLAKNHTAQHFLGVQGQENYWYEAREFLDSDGKNLGPQLLESLHNPYVTHLSKISNMSINGSERLEKSKELVHCYNLWGLYERLPVFLNDFSQLLGCSNTVGLPKVNVTKERIAVNEVSSQMRQRLEGLLGLDLELYEWLKSEWESRPNKADSEARESLWLPYERDSLANDRQSACFTLVDARLVNESNRLSCGDLIEFVVDFSVSRAFDELEIGIYIFDENGEWAFGTNSSLLEKRIVTVDEGLHSVTYTLIADMPEGSYKAGFGFAVPGRGEEAPPEEIAWFDPFIEFQVNLRRVVPSVGYLSLPTVISCTKCASYPVALSEVVV